MSKKISSAKIKDISTSKIVYTDKLPKLSELGAETLIIYDKILVKKSPSFKKWIQAANLSYGVEAGESLKDVAHFPEHITHIVKLCREVSSRKLTIVVVGGGSVGDFGGFIASILKRGVRLVQIPSTWLAAIDSAHGGKTALNVGSAKNQIGTIYPAAQVVLCKELLSLQGDARAFEGFGELIKIALLEGGVFWKKLSQEKFVNSKLLWDYLKPAINAKLKIVAKDPQEKLGYRHLLNLGHTFGHVLEAQFQLPHGIAINYGLEFSLRYSRAKNLISKAAFEDLMKTPIMGYLLSAERDHLISASEATLKKQRSLLLTDKKKTSANAVRFIFLKNAGKPVIKEVTVDEILIEALRQKEEELYA